MQPKGIPVPPLPLIDGCLFVDNSSWMENINTCHRKLQLTSLNKRISAGEKPALNFGSSIHVMTEMRYARYGNLPVDDQFFEDLSMVLTDFFEIHPCPLEDWRDLNWSMSIARQYARRYEREEFNLLSYPEPIPCHPCNGTGEYINHTGPTKKPCPFCTGSGQRKFIVELPFTVPLYERRMSSGILVKVIYIGRIDLPYSLNSELFVNDFKTTSLLGEQFWNKMRRSAQQKGYCWAFNKVLNQPIRGYQIRAIRTKQPPDYVLANRPSPRGGKSQSPAQWWQESLAQEHFLLNSDDLLKWEYNTIDLMEEFFFHYERGYMPEKTEWCSSYGKCPYFSLCNLNSEDQERYLASGLFVDNTWSPLHESTQSKQ